LIFGLSLLALLLALRRFAPKIPPALVVCVIATIASLALGLEHLGVAIVGQLPRGLPAFAIPLLDWRDLHQLLPAAFSIAFLTYTEGILLARAFAAKNGYEVNANQELAALGLADFFTGLFQGFSVTGSQARTAINDATGGKTQLASLVAALTLAFFLLFLTPMITHLPVVALAVVLIYGGSTLVEFEVMTRIYRYYPRSAGVAAGVVLSLLGLINRISNPPDALLREVPGHGFHDIGNSALGQTVPGFVVYRFYAPLLFCNSDYFVNRVRNLIAQSPTPVVWFLLDAQAITDIDVTAAESLRDLYQELQNRGVALKIAHANPPLRMVLEKIGLASELKEESFFASVHECEEAFKSLQAK
jgi:SulP family sulfate permease